MFVSCWSAKGGSGTTVVAAALALLLARSQPPGALLLDAAGDAPAALGVPEPSSPGLAEWLAAGASVPADGLARIEVPAAPGLGLVPRGAGPLAPVARAEVLAGLLAAEHRPVVADCGRLDPGGGADAEAARTLASSADRSLLVTRACYLSLRRAVALALRPTGVVLVVEAGRALGAPDVEDVLGVPVLAEVDVDPAVARAVDAGLLAGRVPRGLERALQPVAVARAG